MRTLLVSLALIATSACSEDVLTGAHAEFQAKLVLPGGSAELTQVVDARERPEVSAITRACGQLVASQSTVSVVSYEGGTLGAPFTLTATLIDGATETPMFTWNGTLEQGGRLTSFDRAETGYSSAAGDAIETILKRPNPSYQVRYRFTAPSAPAVTTLQVVQYLEFAVDAAECSAN